MHNYSLDDTIVAISTSIGGEAAIGIVRMSGADAETILRRIFRPRHPPRNGYRSQQFYYGHIVEPDTARVVDEVLATYMRAPATYTRQDVVEIHSHGGAMPLQNVLQLCLKEGARLAQPGEFTLRAFLNGRIDLSQAEAVLDVIRACTETGLRVAVEQLSGHLTAEVRAVREDIMAVLAYITASIDFPDDEIPPRDMEPALLAAREKLNELLAQADRGIVYRQGVHTAIVGKPNVGKSSLLNALLRTNRAIVTDIPGTTRDTVEETLNLRGVPLVLIDTAGITHSENVVERIGIERSRAAIAQADLVLFVVDGSAPPTAADLEIAAALPSKRVLVVVNKRDLGAAVPQWAEVLPRAPHLPISALTGAGIADLEAMIVETVFGGEVHAADAPLVSNPRHQAALHHAAQHVTAALEGWRGDIPVDFVTIDLTTALYALGEITGETASEDLLDTIFSNFCIGK